MPEKKCVACGSERRETAFDFGDTQIYRCLSCGLGVADPIPAREDLKKRYEAEYYESGYSEGIERRPSEAAARLLDILEKRTGKGRLLDIGCGAGAYLAAARERGWAATGVDVSPFAADFVREKLGIPVRNGFLEDAGFEESSFDAAIMVHSLEHQQDPAATLGLTKSLLKPGGVLFVSVPNFSGVSALKRGVEWEGLQPGFHFYFFTPDSLRGIAARAGFEELEVSAPAEIISGAGVDAVLGSRIGALARRAARGLMGGAIDRARNRASGPAGGDTITMTARRPEVGI